MASAPISLQAYLGELEDSRRCPRHLLLDIMVIAVCAVICGANDWPQVVTFGRERQTWLASFLALPKGIPSHDTFGRVFARINPRALTKVLQQWTQAVAAGLGIKHIAIDGKTLRGSAAKTKGLGALHIVSAWASAQHLSLGQVAVDSKSNEITAIPELLELLNIRGALVTIDAMGCQKAIAQQVRENGGHYALTVKDNQEHLLLDIQNALIEADDKDFVNMEYDTYETREHGHGREEYRSYIVLHSTVGLRHAADWRDLTTIGLCYSTRTMNGKTSEETRYFIGSQKASAKIYGQALRHHWGIENNLHWQLDVTFREDSSRIQERQEAENFASIRKLALMLLKRHPSKQSIACKRLRAALDVSFLEKILK